MPRLPFALLAAAAALLQACTGGYMMDSEVQAVSRLQGLAGPATYSFERLPSQGSSMATVEAAAEPALQRAGLRRDDAAPRYRVQASALAEPGVSPWADTFNPALGGLGSFGAASLDRDYNWVYSQVHLVLRDASTGQVVYESRARSDGPRLDPRSTFEGLFAAALQGFPNPPAGPRTVAVQLGTGGAQARGPAVPAGSLWPSTPVN